MHPSKGPKGRGPDRGNAEVAAAAKRHSQKQLMVEQQQIVEKQQMVEQQIAGQQMVEQ